ncbi:hypothetical protein BVY03_02115 [bacterium K02(2017)]|nr:hypothetical protein BVY03_02115 [bacterium K02(2017)]
MLDFNIINLLLIAISCFFTSALSGTIGMGGGVLLLAVLTFFFPIQILIPLHGIIQLVSNTSRVYLLRKHVHKQIFKYFIVGIPFGSILAFIVIKEIQDRSIWLLIIAALIFYTVFKPKKLPPLKLKIPYFFFLGLVAGTLGPLIGATGPFLAPFFLRDDLKKENIVATKAICQAVIHVFKIPVFLFVGVNYADYGVVLIIMCVVTILGTLQGVKILKKISPKVFTYLFKAALLIAGLRILYKVFWLS